MAAESLPFSIEGLGGTPSGIAGALADPVDTDDVWIDNMKHWGVSGSLQGKDLSAQVPTASADSQVAVSLSVDDKGRIRRLRIEGAVVRDDQSDAVWVLDLGSYYEYVQIASPRAGVNVVRAPIAVNGVFGSTHTPLPSALSKLYAALVRARWVSAWGRLPGALPEAAISPACGPTWLKYLSTLSK